jgi:hypothetical protein
MTQPTQSESRYSGPFPVRMCDGFICRNAADYQTWVARRQAQNSGGARRVQTHDTARSGYTIGDELRARAGRDGSDPNEANQVSTESHEHAARELESAGQPTSAIAGWLQAACGHSRDGNHAGVIQCITRAARLAGSPKFEPFVSKKATGDAQTAADAEGVEVVDVANRRDVLLGEQLQREPARAASDGTTTDASEGDVETVDLSTRHDIALGPLGEE